MHAVWAGTMATLGRRHPVQVGNTRGRASGRRRVLAYLERALARSGDGGFITGPGGKILFWNCAAERILGHSARATLGRHCCDVLRGRDDAGNRLCYPGTCRIRGLLRAGEPISSYDLHTHTKAGEPIWINMSVLALELDGDIDPVVVHLFHDVTPTRTLLALVHERMSAARPAPAPAPAPARLTARELDILRLLADGLDTATMAERLHVSRATIRTHVQNVFAKLEVHSRLGVVAYAARHRLL